MATVAISFEADIDSLRAALEEIEQKTEGAAAGLEKTSDSAKTAGSSLGRYAKVASRAAGMAAAAAAAVGIFASQMAASANEIGDMSRQTGIATDTLAALRLAAKSSGRELQDLEGLLRKVTAEGMDIRDVVIQIQSIESPAGRAAKAMELLGEEGAVLAQVVGDRNFADFEEFVRRFGADTGPEAAEAASLFRERLEETKVIAEGFLSGPAVGLQNWLIGLIENVNKTAIFLGGLVAAFAELGIATYEGRDANEAYRAKIAESQADLIAYYRLLNTSTESTQTFSGATDDSAEAQKRHAEALKAFRAELEKINFKQTAEDILDMAKAYEQMTGAFGGVEVRQSTFAINELAKTTELSGESLDDVVRKAKRLQAIQDFGAAASDGLASVAAGGQAVSMVATQIGDAFEAFGAKSEKAARVAFAANKAAGIADAVVKTAQGIMNAFATLPTPVALGVAPFVAATGAAQIATIAATTFEGGGGGGAGGGIGTSGLGALDDLTTGGAASTVPSVTKGFEEDVTGTRMTRGGMTYRHRDLDVVARDGRRYPGGAFDAGGGTGQTRYDS